MSKKEIAVFSIIVGLIIGASTALLVWDYKKDTKNFKNKCERLAELSDRKYIAEGFDCYIFNQDSIEKVQP